MYHPERTLKGNPLHVGLEYEDVYLQPERGICLHGWWIPGPKHAPPLTWLLFHGNGGNISTRLDGFRMLHDTIGASILAMDYRNFGLSMGQPDEKSMNSDAEAAAKWAEERSSGPIVYHGISLGSAVVAHLAMVRKPDALILESAIASVRRMGFIRAKPKILAFLYLLLRSRFDTEQYVAKQYAPVLVLHGDKDLTVPPICSRYIWIAAHYPKEFVLLPGADHNRPDLTTPKEYYGAITRFLREHLSWVGIDEVRVT